MSNRKINLTEDQFLFAQEEIIFNVTEDILLAMEKLKVSKAELSERIGKSKSHVTQLLSGARNMTLRTLSDINLSLGTDIKISILVDGKDVSIHENREWRSSPIQDTPYLNNINFEKTIEISRRTLNKNAFGYSHEE
ncbi:helix-turn-helix transcriptional regulator [Proteus penneri]|uniref:helix-turn-helix domain-containing protein n=1 Tax=Proteus penneri TaxID=102862 RepID=UPI0020985DAD|nr:helix-turn-helix transcriptional regulator [Proteus penneri]MCO8052629.1 helix-turn-helix transcriptional regulator [Proteus penneri]